MSNHWQIITLGALCSCLLCCPVAAGDHYSDAASTPVLPPLLEWHGASRNLALPATSDDPWITPAERSGLRSSPDYQTTVSWLQRLAAASHRMEMVEIGTSGEGRAIWMAVVSARPARPGDGGEAQRKPVVLVQAVTPDGDHVP